ncbi:hypothetical protein ATCM_07525 [Stenotrophomonas sp. ATCM1_4]|nr:hypothetical protein ATCM_07525 [Stenotrophomonas sp. ATCM1_4]
MSQIKHPLIAARLPASARRSAANRTRPAGTSRSGAHCSGPHSSPHTSLLRHQQRGTAAGRELFAVSRTQRASTNDADRLRKYLAKFGLDWEQVRERTVGK